MSAAKKKQVRPVSQPLWRNLQHAAAPVSVRDLSREADLPPAAVRPRLRLWVLAGLLQRIEGMPPRYVMNDNTPAKPPNISPDGTIVPLGSSRDRLWRAIRVLRTFDLPTLMMASESTERATANYLNALRRAGYVVMTRHGASNTGRPFPMYRLIRHSGPRTPSVSHGRANGRSFVIFIDPNTGDRIDISPGSVSLGRAPKVPAKAARL